MMLWEIRDEDAEEDETDEAVSGLIEDQKRRIDLH